MFKKKRQVYLSAFFSAILKAEFCQEKPSEAILILSIRERVKEKLTT